MDASSDTEEPGAYSILFDFLGAFVEGYPHVLVTDEKNRTKREKKSRTFYVGAEGSEVRLCLYEKGKMPGFEHCPHLVRVELRVCLDEPDDQLTLSTMDAEQIWGWSKWSTMLAPQILCTHVPRCGKSKVQAKTTVQQKADNCARSYGPHLESMFELCGGQENFGPWMLGLYEAQRTASVTNRGGKKRERARGKMIEHGH
jgi:hypothetical protein